ncbi:MAG: carbohydrate ABC transporter permease [Spirochaetaceae bacterium]|nr:carbohydrate ABC transporter permease [Spirochaetaceae bacterium]
MVDFRSRADRLFDRVNVAMLTVVLVATLYPVYFVVIASVSSPTLVSAGHVYLWPEGFNVEGYTYILRDKRIMIGYRNSLIYAVGQTVVSLVLTIPAAYALSRRDMRWRGLIMFYFVFTLYFTGGIIPFYVVVLKLGLKDSIWSLMLPNAVNVFNLIVARTFFQSNIPDELLESAQLDGCTNTRFFISIVLPVGQAIIAIVVLFNVVQNWNAFFHALLFINDQAKYPLQLVLRRMLILNQLLSGGGEGLEALSPEEIQRRQLLADLLRYGTIVVAIAPLMILYPFIQRHFVKGIMVGSIKG